MTIITKTFEGHTKPNQENLNEYFLPFHSKGENDYQPTRRVTVVIPFFNEESHELERTLCSLRNQEDECKDMNVEFFYVAIMDGYYKASPSMISYIKKIYGNSWAINMPYKDEPDVTIILQSKNDDGTLGEVVVSPGYKLRLTVIVKKDNRKKTNSHEWFFRGFSPYYEGDYLYTTDCGTLYSRGCMYHLINYLDEHHDVSAVTGRQRVMSSNMQNLKTESVIQMWFRAAQAYDYEASISSFQGAFSLIGMLPVLPGPCGLYRSDDINGECLDYYMNYVNETTPDDGIIAGNLLLAEDRILSYAACLKTGKYTRWVPSSIFYFEAETDSEKFIAQRRRWTNGTFACYIHLLFLNPWIIFGSNHTFYFKIMVYIQLLIQAFLYIITAVSPSIFISLVFFSLQTLNIGGDMNNYISYAVTGTYITIYLGYTIGHYFIKFMRPFFNFLLMWNTIMFMFVIGMSITTFININIVSVIVLSLTLFFPFFLAILHSIDVFFMMIFNFIPFFFFLPTFIPWFNAYSYSRTWDLSWGNRPSNYDTDTIRVQRILKIKSALICMFVICCNIGLFIGFYIIDNMDTLIFISVGIISISLAQQFLSFFYYLFYTDHMLSSTFDRFGKMITQIVSGFLFIVTITLFLTGLFTPCWLTNTLSVSQRVNDTVLFNKTYEAWYGRSLIADSKFNFIEDMDIEILDVKKYINTEIISKTKIYNLDPFEMFPKINFNSYKFSAYYVNNTVINTTYNYIYYNNGTEVSNGTKTYTDFVDYLNISYYDDFGNQYTTISEVTDKNYSSKYMFIEDYNHTINTYKYDIYYEYVAGYVDMSYGLLFIKYDWEEGVDYKSETKVWGSDILWHFPNYLWSFTLIMFMGIFIMFIMIMISMFYSLFIRDKSRVYSISILYSWITIALMFIGTLLFPASWYDLNTYHVGWWNPEKEELRYMCGMNTTYYNPGDCSIGWSYILIVVSFFTGVFSYNCIKFSIGRFGHKASYIGVVDEEAVLFNNEYIPIDEDDKKSSIIVSV